MILIADSGSTKTDWQLISTSGKVLGQHRSVGINPFYLSQETVNLRFEEAFQGISQLGTCDVFFFGAGCSTAQSIVKVQKAIGRLLPSAKVSVQSDLVGAGLATVGDGKGVVGILGTGANVGYFEDGELRVSPPSNGIWFGDEGGAGYLGKKLIGEYLDERLPQDVRQLFESRFADRRPDILENVYRKPFPNRYLAGFVPFIHEELHHPYLQHLVLAGFESFFELRVSRIPDSHSCPIYLVGSMASYFETYVRMAAQSHGLEIAGVIQKPIDGLVRYFSDQ